MAIHRYYPACYHVWLTPRNSDIEEKYEPCFPNRYKAIQWANKYESWGYGITRVRKVTLI